MRIQPKRTALAARRKKNALNKRASRRAITPKSDKMVLRVNVNDRSKSVLASNMNGYDEVPSVDSMVSSLTPSLSTLDILSSSSASVCSDIGQPIEEEEEKPIVKKLSANNDDIYRILPDLRNDFQEVNRDGNESVLSPIMKGITSSCTSTPLTLESQRQDALNRHLKEANDFLWLGDACNAELEYKKALEKCKLCKDHVLVSHVFNAYGNFLSACLKNHKRATIVLSQASALKKSGSRRKINLCRAISFTSLGKVYLRRSLETGIKDEGMKNLKRADVCFSAALELFLVYNRTKKTEQVIELMAQSMDFRVGDQRTLWNEAIIKEAQEYSEDDDDDDDDKDLDMSLGSHSMHSYDDCMDQPLSLCDDGYYSDSENKCCGWKMCFFSSDPEPDPADNLTLLREHLADPRRYR